MLEETISTIYTFGNITINLIDSTGSILITLFVCWVIYSLTSSIFRGLKSVFKESKENKK